MIATANPVDVYRPYGGAKRLFESQSKKIVFEGPAGTGKTMAVLNKAFAMATMHAKSRILFIRQERTALNQAVLVAFENDVLPAGHEALTGANRAYRTTYVFANGSEIALGGLDRPDKIMSAQYDMVCVFEATDIFPESAAKLLTRIRCDNMPYRQIIFDCNPKGPSHWLNIMAKEDVSCERILSRHVDNPVFYDRDGAITKRGEEYIGDLETLPGALKDRLLRGRWVASEGVIYSNFDQVRHVSDYDFAPDRTIIACDDGFNNPFVALLMHLDYDGNLFIEREVYESGISESGKIELIEGLGIMGDVEAVVIDPSAAALKAAVRSAGHCVIDGNNKPVFDGIVRCITRFSKGTIRIHPRCVNLRDELDTYAWRQTREGNTKDEPIKENDHACDAMRYGVGYYDTKNASQVVWING